jgi:predicted transcriptional regulator
MAYIDKHLSDGPGRIAHDLGRPPGTVRSYIYRKRQEKGALAQLIINVPATLLRTAREKGLTKEEIDSTARVAILKKVRIIR